MHAPPDIPLFEQTKNGKQVQVAVPPQAAGTPAQKGAGCGVVAVQFKHAG